MDSGKVKEKAKVRIRVVRSHSGSRGHRTIISSHLTRRVADGDKRLSLVTLTRVLLCLWGLNGMCSILKFWGKAL